jgi:hypothetical protein
MRKNKRKFSGFKLSEAYKELNIKRLQDWKLEFKPFKPSDFFYERLKRLDNFGVSHSESGKELIIDAFLEEVLNKHTKLRAWKEVILETDEFTGLADYLISLRYDYLDLPFLCVAEAKKDKFEQGLAQCLIEMKVCQTKNEESGKKIEIFGIVSNGTTWQFYKLSKENEVFESEPFVISDEEKLLGVLNLVLSLCEKNLS